MGRVVWCYVCLMSAICAADTSQESRLFEAMTRVHTQKPMSDEPVHHAGRVVGSVNRTAKSLPPLWLSDPAVSFLETRSDIGEGQGLRNTMLTVQFCKSGIAHELKSHISKDIAEMESTESKARAVSLSVSAFNEFFLKPFLDMLRRLMLNNLIKAFGDVLPWYMIGPITSILAGMAPKPVTSSVSAMLGLFLPPIVAIGLTKKLVKSVTLLLTAGVVSSIERQRRGGMPESDAGDGGGAQKVIAKEITRRLGVDLTNHLMDSVPRATERALSHTLASSLSTSVQMYYYCTYCYHYGDYCQQCFYLPDYTWKEAQWWKEQGEKRPLQT